MQPGSGRSEGTHVLQELVVSNFAIIRNLEVSFREGFNILTGETGAGKSIIVGAVNLVLGGRASQEMIRTGTTEAFVEALFTFSDPGKVPALMQDLGLAPARDMQVRRSISRTGRNRIFVNDQVVSLQQLQHLVRGLISVSGQHEHQLLLDPEVHLDLLDNFGDLHPLCSDVAALHAKWAETREELRGLRKFRQEQASKLDWMRFQLQELDSAKLKPGEDGQLEGERNILRHSAALLDAAQGAYRDIYEAKGAILERLADVQKNVATLARIDPSQVPLLAELEQGRIQLEELARSLQQYAGRMSFDPQRLAAIEERLSLFQKLGKKYGGTVDAMIERLDELRRTLAQGEDTDLREEELNRTLGKLRKDYLDAAGALSAKRHEAAERLSEEVRLVLAALDMPRVRFSAAFTDPGNTADGDPVFTSRGIDRVEFLLSANPGEDLKPLAKIASGGELSRILLALKSLLSLKGEGETLIFDEVDAGIGGRTAELVGLQLKRLADRHQVICITHLPQIACYGEVHYKVAKRASGQETVTSIVPLGQEERVEELARMLGGISISENTRAHAREFLQKAHAPQGT